METTFRVAEASDADSPPASMRGLYEQEHIHFDEPSARAAPPALTAGESYGLAHRPTRRL